MVKKGNVFINDVQTVTIIGDYAVASYNNAVNPENTSTSLILFKDSEIVGELDTSTINMSYVGERFSLDLSKDSLYIVLIENGVFTNVEFDLKTGRLKNKKTLQDTDVKTLNLLDFTATDHGDLCRITSLGRIEMFDTNSQTSKIMVDTS